MDPELAMALRISLEEERARQQPAQTEAPKEGAAAQQQVNVPAADDEEMDEEAILEQAKLLSMQQEAQA